MRNDTRTLDMVCCAGLIALAIGGTIAALKSVAARADVFDRQREAAEMRLRELNQAQTTLGRLSDVLKVNQTALETLQKRLPESERIGQFLADLDALAGRHGVRVNNVRPGRAIREEICTRTPLSFSCEGRFSDLHALLYGLESMERLVRIEEVDMVRDSLETGCTLDVKCNVYMREDDSGANG